MLLKKLKASFLICVFELPKRCTSNFSRIAWNIKGTIIDRDVIITIIATTTNTEANGRKIKLLGDIEPNKRTLYKQVIKRAYQNYPRNDLLGY